MLPGRFSGLSAGKLRNLSKKLLLFALVLGVLLLSGCAPTQITIVTESARASDTQLPTEETGAPTQTQPPQSETAESAPPQSETEATQAPTEPPTAAPTASESAATEVSEPPVTEPPETQAPETQPQETQPPVTEAPPVTTGRTYVLNTNTKKFHNPDCRYVDKIKDSNRQDYTGNRSDLLNMGYEPCKKCNP